MVALKCDWIVICSLHIGKVYQIGICIHHHLSKTVPERFSVDAPGPRCLLEAPPAPTPGCVLLATLTSPCTQAPWAWSWADSTSAWLGTEDGLGALPPLSGSGRPERAGAGQEEVPHWRKPPLLVHSFFQYVKLRKLSLESTSSGET